MRKTLLALSLCSTLLIGCSGLPKKEIVIHVIEGKDYHEEKTGDVVNFVCLTPTKFQEIAKARLGK